MHLLGLAIGAEGTPRTGNTPEIYMHARDQSAMIPYSNDLVLRKD